MLFKKLNGNQVIEKVKSILVFSGISFKQKDTRYGSEYFTCYINNKTVIIRVSNHHPLIKNPCDFNVLTHFKSKSSHMDDLNKSVIKQHRQVLLFRKYVKDIAN